MKAIQILIIIGILAIGPISIWLMLLYNKKQANAEIQKKKKNKKANKNLSETREDIENAIGIHEIKHNIIKEKDGTVAVVLEYSTPDYSTLKEEEQDIFEQKLARAAISMDVVFKNIEIAGNVKTLKANHKIYETIDRGILTEEATVYAKRLAKALSDKRYDMTSLERKKYLVLGSKKETEEDSIIDLKKQISKVITNFSKADTVMTILETSDIIQLQNRLINYESQIDIRTVEEQGVFELFSTGGR